MTLNEALVLGKGDYVCHPAKLDYRKVSGDPVKPPMRVTEVWINVKRTIVMIRIASVDATAWLDATGYELPPSGMEYDKLDREWISPAEMRKRKSERRNGVAA